MPRPVFETLPVGHADPSLAQVGESAVWFEDPSGLAPHLTRLYTRDLLRANNRLTGPALLFQLDATTVIPPGWLGAVDGWGNLLLERG
jgi:N-methylhydantoinase A